jgi:hypothetical protein
VEVACLGQGGFLGQVGDSLHVDFRLGGGDPLFELVPADGEGLILLPEPSLVDHPGLVKVVELVDLDRELSVLTFEDFEEVGLLLEELVRSV